MDERLRVLEAAWNDLTNAKRIYNVGLQKWAEMACPYKKGDRTTCQGYTWNGKPCVVKMISGKRDFTGLYQWRVTVAVLRKDGSEGRYAEWDEDQEGNTPVETPKD